MKRLLFCTCLFLSLSTIAFGADAENENAPIDKAVTGVNAIVMEPFVLPYDDATIGPAYSGLWRDKTSASAAIASPLRVSEDGHIYSGTNRVRFWGVNLKGPDCFQTHDETDAMIGRLIKFGINGVRLYDLDNGQFPNGILKNGGGDTRQLDPEALDRLDYLIAKLKENGIYTDISLLTSRPFTMDDLLPRSIDDMSGNDRLMASMFSDPLIELQHEYADNFFKHLNSYTNLTYAKDPAIGIIEIANNIGLVQAWISGTLDTLPDFFSQDLMAKWNTWLRAKYGDTATLQKAWNIENRPFGDELLKNGDFLSATSGWDLDFNPPVQAESMVLPDGPVQDNAMQIKVTSVGKGGWAQLSQSGLPVKKGEVYTLSFWARADYIANLQVQYETSSNPPTPFMLRQKIDLTGIWKSFIYTAIADRDEPAAKVVFNNLGATKGKVEIAGVPNRRHDDPLSHGNARGHQ
jgi:hypothetical protein